MQLEELEFSREHFDALDFLHARGRGSCVKPLENSLLLQLIANFLAVMPSL